MFSYVEELSNGMGELEMYLIIIQYGRRKEKRLTVYVNEEKTGDYVQEIRHVFRLLGGMVSSSECRTQSQSEDW